MIKLFLTKSSIPGSRYPTVASAFFVESIFDACVGVLVLIYAFTQGIFPKPPDFAKLSSFDISFFAEHFRFTLFLITLLAVIADRRVRAAVRPRARVLAARAPGPDDPDRQTALPARSRSAPGGRLALPLRRLLVPARSVPRRRLGAERAARVRGRAGRRRRPVHAGRRGRPAGAAREGLLRQGGLDSRRRLLGRSADRDRRLHRDRRARGGDLHLPLPLVQRGDHRRPRLPAGGEGRRARRAARPGGCRRLRRSPARRAARGARARLTTEVPRAPRGPARRPRGRRGRSRCGSAPPGPRRCPGC